ncbi:RhoGEF domain-containing protein [Planoprotostelium fungivorum]|uniref:RhoGEF domain-containing protein n=1 Tax=Planoprotostelium fungivorum TaxID=1890364 RepID=A0A2P6NLL1_9EUKA|nr:RhoGEF domain-containing protein [Planoprotostelium fungivorum]
MCGEQYHEAGGLPSYRPLRVVLVVSNNREPTEVIGSSPAKTSFYYLSGIFLTFRTTKRAAIDSDNNSECSPRNLMGSDSHSMDYPAPEDSPRSPGGSFIASNRPRTASRTGILIGRERSSSKEEEDESDRSMSPLGSHRSLIHDSSTDNSANNTLSKALTEEFLAQIQDVDPAKVVRIQSVLRMCRARIAFKVMLKQKQRRIHIIEEILKTEESYVTFLNLVVEQFQKPLRSEPDLMTEEAHRLIFSNIEMIQKYNDVFLSQLKQRVSNFDTHTTLFGDCFLMIADFLKAYSAYVNYYNQGQVQLLTSRHSNKSLDRWLNEKKLLPEAQNKGIGDLLIMPVQRVPRYSMLLSDLVKSTWNHHPDYENLCKARDKISSLADFMNEQKRKFENQLRVSSIFLSITNLGGVTMLSPSRTFVREGSLMETDLYGEKRTCYVFLFNDLIIWTTPEKKKKGEENYTMKRLAYLADVAVAIGAAGGKVAIGLGMGNENILLMGNSEDETNDWAQDIITNRSDTVEKDSLLPYEKRKTFATVELKKKDTKFKFGQIFVPKKEEPTPIITSDEEDSNGERKRLEKKPSKAVMNITSKFSKPDSSKSSKKEKEEKKEREEKERREKEEKEKKEREEKEKKTASADKTRILRTFSEDSNDQRVRLCGADEIRDRFASMTTANKSATLMAPRSKVTNGMSVTNMFKQGSPTTTISGSSSFISGGNTNSSSFISGGNNNSSSFISGGNSNSSSFISGGNSNSTIPNGSKSGREMRRSCSIDGATKLQDPPADLTSPPGRQRKNLAKLLANTTEEKQMLTEERQKARSFISVGKEKEGSNGGTTPPLGSTTPPVAHSPTVTMSPILSNRGEAAPEKKEAPGPSPPVSPPPLGPRPPIAAIPLHGMLPRDRAVTYSASMGSMASRNAPASPAPAPPPQAMKPRRNFS